ncbi:malonyl-[acyl-carrier protein] O-methyltransferase BioC [Anaerobacillus alkalilacustris]|uniref:Malonyl-[acyl-carrier protein] O-methyltransferase n=1 Tax=Anaerobacillus alkalilacustris TaxID=393763 RepID=A0A1S2LKS6_9BACI|nr:malonyl-ACP O-methyltransferase BioC [Anaerobacillus alkalilacustris]OIJ13061.1 malonyl-[acyl-carrier protein] O-methyltransferase BioC [Anaerobacillus alkalilacustris]
MIDKKLLQRRFSRNSRTYDKYANVQKIMAKELIKTIDKEKNDKEINILEIGCGTGYLTKQLCMIFPNAKITAVDLAPGMIEVAKEKLKGMSVTFLCGDIEEISLKGNYDIIVSNATFQWVNDFEEVIKRLLLFLREDGILTFSTFGNRTFQELHNSYNQVKEQLGHCSIRPLGQSFFSFETLYQFCETSLLFTFLANFDIKGKQMIEYEYFPSVRDFLTSIKKIGASNSNQENVYLPPTFFKELIRFYEKNYREVKGVRATYHCMYISIHYVRTEDQ